MVGRAGKISFCIRYIYWRYQRHAFQRTFGSGYPAVQGQPKGSAGPVSCIQIAIMCILVHGAFKMVLQNTQSRTAALGIPYSVLYFGGIITGISIAILAVTNIVYALKHPEEITDIVTMHNDDDEIAAEAMEQAEELSDDEYVKRLNEQGGK